MAILIVSAPNDADAHAVKFAINDLGEQCDIFYSYDYCDMAEWSLDLNQERFHSEYRGVSEEWDFSRYKSVWMRRPASVVPRTHICDDRERAAAEAEARSFLSSTLRLIEKDKFVASPIASVRRANEKIYQFREALKVGLPMPPTLISNSKARILDFFDVQNQDIIYKTLVPMMWQIEDNRFASTPTTAISNPRVLMECDLASAPGIYQKRIEKLAEVRVTVLGRTILALEKTFPTRLLCDLQVDWRAIHSEAAYKHIQLPSALSERIFKLLENLNLVMGCLDFIVDLEGNYTFLEINPQGQFLWIDQVRPEMNHLEAMVEFLLSSDPNFVYKNTDNINLSSVSRRDRYDALSRNERERHFGEINSIAFGQLSMSLL